MHHNRQSTDARLNIASAVWGPVDSFRGVEGRTIEEFVEYSRSSRKMESSEAIQQRSVAVDNLRVTGLHTRTNPRLAIPFLCCSILCQSSIPRMVFLMSIYFRAPKLAPPGHLALLLLLPSIQASGPLLHHLFCQTLSRNIAPSLS